MAEKTCAACDCRLDGNAIEVKIGARVVEVCCEECAHKLREAIAGENAIPGSTREFNEAVSAPWVSTSELPTHQ
jgi:hypothetical protein